MVRVLAQKVTGSCRMCASCSAVTKTGYLVKRGGAELFVCQSCFTAQFGSDYQLVRSFEPEPVRPRPRPVARPRQVEPAPARLSGLVRLSGPARRSAEAGCCGSWRRWSIGA